jgi:DNA-binding transcriptional LysR family regulator
VFPHVVRGLQFEKLTDEPIRLAVAPKHPFASRRVVTPEEAAREPFIAYNSALRISTERDARVG